MGSLTLLAPKALWLLGLLVPLLILYILKVRRQTRRIGSTWLWKSAQRDLMARSPFKKLIVQLPLILQALALIALAIAAATPSTRGTGASGDHIAIIIDTSASMGAREGDTTRLALAKKAALDRIDALAPGSDVMLLDAGRDARLVLPPDRDRRRMATALDKIEVRDVEGDLGAAIALAASRLKQVGGDRKILVFSDGNLAHPAPMKTGAIPLELLRVGTAVDNTAIVRLDVRSGRDSGGREQVQAFLMLANLGASERQIYVTMRLSGSDEVVASRRLSLPSGAREPAVLTFVPSAEDAGRGLVFELSPNDALAVDDRAYGRVPPGRRLPVVLASDADAVWLRRVLKADHEVDLEERRLSALRDDVPTDAFVVVNRACPAEIPGGDVLIVGPPGGTCFGTKVGPTIETPRITSWAQGDPRMRFLSLDHVHIDIARLLDVPSKRQELVRADRGVLISDISTSRRTGTLVGFDVGESNWPLRASYVLFIRNLLEQARLHRNAGIVGAARSGRPLRVALPSSVEAVMLESPGAPPRELQVRDGIAVIPEVDRVGHYALSWEQPSAGSRVVPVNLTSTLESDLRSPLDDSGELTV
ncbi:VWA domain-containing protein, partial [Desulfobulbus sp. AH-315-M07]|nr:VWA domain-containing protein [Desulfobulbus sp. AH-315-M07]